MEEQHHTEEKTVNLEHLVKNWISLIFIHDPDEATILFLFDKVGYNSKVLEYVASILGWDNKELSGFGLTLQDQWDALSDMFYMIFMRNTNEQVLRCIIKPDAPNFDKILSFFHEVKTIQKTL